MRERPVLSRWDPTGLSAPNGNSSLRKINTERELCNHGSVTVQARYGSEKALSRH